jgi:flagellar basal body-associated protein FliL
MTMVGLALSAVWVAPARAAEDKGKKKGGGLSYIQLEPLNAALNFFQGRRKIISVEFGLDVPDSVLHSRAEKSLLILRDAYLRWLTVYAASLPPEAPPNPDAIETELQRETDSILGRPGARIVLGTIMVN